MDCSDTYDSQDINISQPILTLSTPSLQIRAQLSHERISVFDFPGSGRGPWALVGSNTVLKLGEETVWGRSGTSHCILNVESEAVLCGVLNNSQNWAFVFLVVTLHFK